MLSYEIIIPATSWTLLISNFFYRDMLSATQLAMNAKNLVDIADHVRIKHPLINVCSSALSNSKDNSYQIRPDQPFVMTLSSTDEES